MTKDEALAHLNATLPRGVFFGVQRTEFTHTKMQLIGGDRSVRREPPAFGAEEHWIVTLLLEIPGQDQYVESTRGAALEQAVAEAIGKFDAWRSRSAVPEAPPRLAAPGAAERERLERQERERRARDVS